jgi:hypothetical protein
MPVLRRTKVAVNTTVTNTVTAAPMPQRRAPLSRIVALARRRIRPLLLPTARTIATSVVQTITSSMRQRPSISRGAGTVLRRVSDFVGAGTFLDANLTVPVASCVQCVSGIGTVGTAAGTKLKLYGSTTAYSAVNDYAVGVDVSQFWLSAGRYGKFSFITNTIETAAISAAGAFSAASAALVNGITAATADISGALTAASVTLTGALSAATGAFTSTVAAPNLLAASASTQGTGVSWFGSTKQPTYGTYLAQPGAGRSWSGGTAATAAGASSWTLRNRLAASDTVAWCVENANEAVLLAVNGASGDVVAKGTVTAAAFVSTRASEVQVLPIFQVVSGSLSAVNTVMYSEFSISFVARCTTTTVQLSGYGRVYGGSGADACGVKPYLRYGTVTKVLSTTGGFQKLPRSDDASMCANFCMQGTFPTTVGQTYVVGAAVDDNGDDQYEVTACGCIVFHGP